MQMKKIAEHIGVHGWSCLHVAPTGESEEPFSYSIGFGETFGAPEVLVFGFRPERAHALLNACAHLLRNAGAIDRDVEVAGVLAGDYKVVFKPVRPECLDEYLGTAFRYYKDKPFGAVVMFLPDRNHHFPWQIGYEGMSVRESLGIVE